MTHSAKPSEEVVIRLAREADIPALTRLSAQLGYPSSEAQIRERLSRIGRSSVAAIFVAEGSGTVAGWMQLIAQEILETGPRVEVAALVVDERSRGKGIGRRLMQRAEGWARERNCKTILLRSNVTRAGAHAFYERLGFEHVKTSKAFKKTLV